MPIDVVRKISPFLARYMFNRAIVPILIEIDKPLLQQFTDTLGKFNFPLTQKIEGFGFISTFAQPENIKAFAMDNSVLAIYYDMPKYALMKFPLTDITIENPLKSTLINPFKNIKTPSLFPNIAKQKFQDRFSEKFNTTFETRKQIGADLANQEGITGKGVKLATIDTGVDPSHPQLMFKVTVRSTLVGQIADLNGHGTHCLTTNSGKYTKHPVNGIEVMGVAHEATRFSYKCLGFIIGAGRSSDVIKAMEEAYKEGVQVISMSLGSESSQGGYQTDPECRVIQALTNAGVMVVVAAGNSGPDNNTINNPGISPSAITVGAVNPRTFEIANFSSRGPTADGLIKPDVTGAGVDIYSGCAALLDGIGDKLTDRFAILSGTSMATPHIAGLCALLKQKYPDITTGHFFAVMKKQRVKDNVFGWGLPHWDMFSESNLVTTF